MDYFASTFLDFFNFVVILWSFCGHYLMIPIVPLMVPGQTADSPHCFDSSLYPMVTCVRFWLEFDSGLVRFQLGFDSGLVRFQLGSIPAWFDSSLVRSPASFVPSLIRAKLFSCPASFVPSFFRTQASIIPFQMLRTGRALSGPRFSGGGGPFQP